MLRMRKPLELATEEGLVLRGSSNAVPQWLECAELRCKPRGGRECITLGVFAMHV